MTATQDSDAALAAIFRRVLQADHRLGGMQLTIDAAIDLSDAEFDLIWDTLPPLDDDTVLSFPVHRFVSGNEDK